MVSAQSVGSNVFVAFTENPSGGRPKMVVIGARNRHRLVLPFRDLVGFELRPDGEDVNAGPTGCRRRAHGCLTRLRTAWLWCAPDRSSHRSSGRSGGPSWLTISGRASMTDGLSVVNDSRRSASHPIRERTIGRKRRINW